MAFSPPGQIQALTRAFVARFFENEFTTRSGDLSSSFCWLIAFLAPPCLLMPWSRMVAYQRLALESVDLLRHVSMVDKVTYLGFGMAAAGGLAVLTWNALLVDRRDALVLGVLPVRARMIVRAKIAALVIYLGIVFLGMHGPSSAFFGLILSMGNSFLFLVRGIIAHFIASILAAFFMVFLVTSAQGLLLAIAGPRAFARWSALLQVVLAAVALGSLMALPFVSSAVLAGVSADPGTGLWVRQVPSVWFLGLYETILGTDDVVLHGLAARALLMFAAAAATTAIAYPLAYRRLVASAVEVRGAPTRLGVWARAARAFTRLTAGHPATRASMQFTLAVMSRVEQQRFVLAVCIGLVTALLAPATWRMMQDPPLTGSVPSAGVLTMPLVAMTLLLVAVRIAAAIPADLKSGWIVDTVGVDANRVRSGVWRTMFGLSAVVPIALFTLVAAFVWDPVVIVTHAIVALAVGGVVIEALLWGFEGVPCTRGWHPDGANLRTWWFTYVLAFVFITRGTAALSLAVVGSAVGLGVLVLTLVSTIGVIRWTHIRRRVPLVDEDAPTAQVLNIS